MLLWLHALGVPAYGYVVANADVRHALLEGGVVAVFAVAATLPLLGRRARSILASFGLLSASAILIHFSGGLIEMHFHFFVMVPVIALYQDWAPFLLAVAYVLLHHGAFGVLRPESVYNHLPGQTDPWRWALVHSGFIAAISLACVASWRINELMAARQRRAEDELFDEKRVVETLYDISSALAAELDSDHVAQIVTDKATEATGAAYGAFFYNVIDSDGEQTTRYTVSGAPVEAFSSFPIPRNTEIFQPTSSGSEVVRLPDVTAHPRFGKNDPYFGLPKGHLPVRSYLAVPVRSRGSSEVLGGLFFGHPVPGMFGDRAQSIAEGIATQAAIALDNARLYQAERDAHDVAERARGQLALLAEAGRLLTWSLDPATTLTNVSHLTVPMFADLCMIEVIQDDGTIRRERIDTIAGFTELAEALQKFPPDFRNETHSTVRVLRTGTPLIIEIETLEGRIRQARSPEHRAILEGLGATSQVIVPLTGREGVFGAISFVTLAVSGRRFTADDLPLAEEIGRRAGIALENARLYSRQRGVAESLQHALLPERLPDVPGFVTTARYLAGRPGERVGGDWFDLFTVPGGNVAVVMGDVAGHGIPAASLMAQLRNALRAYASDGRPPNDIVRRLNGFLYGIERDGLATLALGILDPVTGAVRLAGAGHPPVLLVRSNGEATFVGEGLGPPLGAAPFSRFDEIELSLRPEDTLLFYTDGLVEDRVTPLDDSLEQLRRTVLAGPNDLESLAQHILDSSLPDTGADDDVALLLLRSERLGDRLMLSLPAEPRVLGSLRQMLRRWLAEHDVAEADVQDVLVACGEACNNAIEHGSVPRGGAFDFEAVLDGELEVMITSRGAWRTPRVDGGGRGLSVMQALMDDVDVQRGPDGTRVRLRRRLQEHPA